MPSIKQASETVSTYPNLFISPYGNDGIIPLYSSIPIEYRTEGGCLPCVLCGNSLVRKQILDQEANMTASGTGENSIKIAIGT